MQAVESNAVLKSDDCQDDFSQLSESELHVQLSEFVLHPLRLLGGASSVLSAPGLALALK
jgi:hypothetical protein